MSVTTKIDHRVIQLKDLKVGDYFMFPGVKEVYRVISPRLTMWFPPLLNTTKPFEELFNVLGREEYNKGSLLFCTSLNDGNIRVYDKGDANLSLEPVIPLSEDMVSIHVDFIGGEKGDRTQTNPDK